MFLFVLRLRLSIDRLPCEHLGWINLIVGMRTKMQMRSRVKYACCLNIDRNFSLEDNFENFKPEQTEFPVSYKLFNRISEAQALRDDYQSADLIPSSPSLFPPSGSSSSEFQILLKPVFDKINEQGEIIKTLQRKVRENSEICTLVSRNQAELRNVNSSTVLNAANIESNPEANITPNRIIASNASRTENEQPVGGRNESANVPRRNESFYFRNNHTRRPYFHRRNYQRQYNYPRPQRNYYNNRNNNPQSHHHYPYHNNHVNRNPAETYQNPYHNYSNYNDRDFYNSEFINRGPNRGRNRFLDRRWRNPFRG